MTFLLSRLLDTFEHVTTLMVIRLNPQSAIPFTVQGYPL